MLALIAEPSLLDHRVHGFARPTLPVDRAVGAPFEAAVHVPPASVARGFCVGRPTLGGMTLRTRMSRRAMPWLSSESKPASVATQAQARAPAPPGVEQQAVKDGWSAPPPVDPVAARIRWVAASHASDSLGSRVTTRRVGRRD